MKLKHIHFILLGILVFSSCRLDKRHETNSTFGWDYNEPDNGGFQKVPFEPMETPPEMVLIEGKEFTEENGLLEIFTFKTKDSVYIDSAIEAFYISKYEETNFQYRSYLDFLKFHGLMEEYQKALPDTTVWNNADLSDDNITFLISNYFRHPHYDYYPVVGLTPEQAQLYANWKTDRLNEAILIREGILEYNADTSDFFTTENYLAGKYPKPKLPELNLEGQKRNKKNLGERIVRLEDGILLPHLRLMTVSEWQWASLCIGDSENKYIVTPKAMKQSKFDKDHHFTYLFAPKSPSSKNIPSIYTINHVKVGFSNNYGVFNLNENISEIILPDSSHISDLGGSWAFREVSHEAIYEFKHKDSLNYKIRNNFIYKNDSLFKPNAYTGFRLVMDYIGTLDETVIKRK